MTYKPHACPDCHVVPVTETDGYGTMVLCRNCYDYCVDLGPSGHSHWGPSLAEAVSYWNEWAEELVLERYTQCLKTIDRL